MSQRFKQFQAAFREDACLEAMMQASRGGISIACPACGRVSAFVPRLKLRAYACGYCNFLVSPCAGTPLESRRTSLQLWFFAIRLLAEQGPKAAAVLEREAGISNEQARRMVGELDAAAKDGAGWFTAARKAVAGGAGLVPAPGIAGGASSSSPTTTSALWLPRKAAGDGTAEAAMVAPLDRPPTTARADVVDDDGDAPAAIDGDDTFDELAGDDDVCMMGEEAAVGGV